MKKLRFMVMALILVSLVFHVTGCKTARVSKNDVNFALIIIDIQNDYFDGGRFTLHNSLGALNNTESILRQFRDRGLPVIHVQHINPRGAGFFEPGTWGVEIHERVKPLENEALIVKHQISSFAGTELEKILKDKDINRLIICGMQSNVCVEATAKDAVLLGFQVIILEDACAALTTDAHDGAMERLQTDFFRATILNTNEFVF
ncbi:MAG: cysteine hydrolase [Treponema sp.]|jgi:nicotinamidase-related amidase|nr:cysteine hydrolase [Treponema sp.]